MTNLAHQSLVHRINARRAMRNDIDPYSLFIGIVCGIVLCLICEFLYLKPSDDLPDVVPSYDSEILAKCLNGMTIGMSDGHELRCKLRKVKGVSNV